MQYPMITGHTGNDGTPDNSLEAVEKSISIGADAFEVDIRRDENSVLVLSHDSKGQCDYDKCIRFTEVLEILTKHPDIRINCDLKEDDLPLEVAAIADDFGIGPERLILTGTVTPSFLEQHPEVVKMADIYLNIEYYFEDFYFKGLIQTDKQIDYNTFHNNPWKNIKEIIPSIDPYIGMISEACLKYGVKGINMPYALLNDENINIFKESHLALSVWTVNDRTDMMRMFSYGVENLTTRCVSLAKDVRKDILGF